MGGESLCHVSCATLLRKWVSRLSRRSSVRGNFSGVYFCSFQCDCCKNRVNELIDFLAAKCFAQSAIQPTGLSRAGGRNHEQTPNLEVGPNGKKQMEKVRKLESSNLKLVLNSFFFMI